MSRRIGPIYPRDFVTRCHYRKVSLGWDMCWRGGWVRMSFISVIGSAGELKKQKIFFCWCQIFFSLKWMVYPRSDTLSICFCYVFVLCGVEYSKKIYKNLCVCVCMCVCAYVRACVRACVCVLGAVANITKKTQNALNWRNTISCITNMQ